MLGSVVALLTGCDLGDAAEPSAVNEAEVIVEFVVVEEFARFPPEEVDEGIRAGLFALPKGRTRIVIELDDHSERLRAGLHTGNCDFLTGEGPEYLLNDFEQDQSETVVDVPLPELRGVRGPGYFILVARPDELSHKTGLCGDLLTAEEN